MTQINIAFQGVSWADVRFQMLDALGLHNEPPKMTTLGEIFDREETAIAAERQPDAPEASAATAPAKPKKARNLAPPAAPAVQPLGPEPQPPVVEAPAAKPNGAARELPSLDALKAVVTAAVRLAQKNEGPKTILDLLPEFKTKTKLDFVMNAKDEHRPALAELIEAAGLPLEPAA